MPGDMTLVKPQFCTGLNHTHPLAKGVTLSYLFNENNGKIVNDLSGSRRNGTFVNNPSWQPGGVEFDASTEHIVSANGSFLQPNGTIAFLYKKTNTPSEYYYFFVLDDDYVEFCYAVHPDEDLNFFEINGRYINWTGVPFLDGAEHIIVLTWREDKTLRIIYNDGILLNSTSNSFTWDAAGMADYRRRHIVGLHFLCGNSVG